MVSRKNPVPFQSDAQLIVAPSEIDANLLYATGFFSPDPFVLYIHKGKKVLVMNDLEIDRARKQARVHTVLSLSEFERQLKKEKRRVIHTAAVLELLFSREGIHSLLVPDDFPLGLADQLRRRGFQVRAKPKPFFKERELKKPDEIKEIEKSLRTAEAGMEAGIELIRDSRPRTNGILSWNGSALTSEIVKQRINSVLLERGGVPSHTIVACGQQACDPHHEGTGPLKANHSIILDIFPRSQASGYWGDITRTVVRGRASEQLRALFEAVERGQQIAFQNIRVGVEAREVHHKIASYFQQRGFETGRRHGRMQGFFHGTGHGVGLEIHEAPRISPKSTDILKAGHVITVEPGLYYSDLGCGRLEDMVVVTAPGYRNLTRFPKYLEV